MKRRLQIIFIIFTLLGLTLPIIRFNKKATISEKENRNLAEKPFMILNNRFNNQLFKQYDSYFSDRFGGRLRLISLNTRLKHIINGSSLIYNDIAIQGKNGWWFYISVPDGNNLRDFYKQNLLNESQLFDFEERIRKTQNWCKEQGIACIFIICPNKHSIYSENYYFKRPKGITRADQLVKAFENEGVNFVFPRDYLISKKAEYNYPLYYETDTHWNSQGAYLASVLLKEKIINIFPDISFPSIQYSTTIDFSMNSGDILPMLGIESSKSTHPSVRPIENENTDFYIYFKNEGRNGVHTKGINVNLPRALIFRDSFFDALEPFISPMFSEAEYKWKQFNESDKEYILEYKPDIIIFESVERYAPMIVQ